MKINKISGGKKFRIYSFIFNYSEKFKSILKKNTNFISNLTNKEYMEEHEKGPAKKTK